MRSPNQLESVFVGSALLAACTSTNYSDRGGQPTGQINATPLSAVEQEDPGRTAVDGVAQTILARAPQPSSVACLPLVTYDAHEKAQYVSTYGEAFADAVAAKVTAGGFKGMVLDADAIGLRIASINGSRASFSTLESAAAQGERLGVDGIVFGTIEHRYGVGDPDRETLTGKVYYFDCAEHRVVDTRTFEASSDRRDLTELWRRNRDKSSWLSDGEWRKAEPQPSLERELDILASQLVQYVAPGVRSSKATGAAYVAPTDTATLVRGVERLRAAQRSLVAELARRETIATQTQTTVDTTSPVIVEGHEFHSVQAAEDWINQVARDLATSEAGRFAASLSDMFSQSVRGILEPMSMRLTDPGFTTPVERFVVDDALATGGLATSAGARESLQKAGIGLVFAPRIERIGTSYRIRLDVFDVGAKDRIASSYVPIHGSFNDELAAALGRVDETGALPPSAR